MGAEDGPDGTSTGVATTWGSTTGLAMGADVGVAVKVGIVTGLATGSCNIKTMYSEAQLETAPGVVQSVSIFPPFPPAPI
jgi:hypothetical protein